MSLASVPTAMSPWESRNGQTISRPEWMDWGLFWTAIFCLFFFPENNHQLFWMIKIQTHLEAEEWTA